jgi:hypothetical protein
VQLRNVLQMQKWRWQLQMQKKDAAAEYARAELGGLAQDLTNFQIVLVPIMSVLTCSTG